MSLSYYNRMSLTKQIAIAILATILLVIFGVGSYFASKQLFPDPKTQGSNGSVTPTPNPGIVTVQQMKDLTPKNIATHVEGENTVIQFETSEKVPSFIYISTAKIDNIGQVLKDYSNGVSVPGRFIWGSTESAPSNTHIVKFPTSILATSGPTYYFVILKFNDHWLPYGTIMDSQGNPTESYVIQAN